MTFLIQNQLIFNQTQSSLDPFITFNINKSTRGETILTIFQDHSNPLMFVHNQSTWQQIKSYDMPKELNVNSTYLFKKILAESSLSTIYCDNGDCRVSLNLRIKGGMSSLARLKKMIENTDENIALLNMIEREIENKVIRVYSPIEESMLILKNTIIGGVIGAGIGIAGAGIGIAVGAALGPIGILIGGVLGCGIGLIIKYFQTKKAIEEYNRIAASLKDSIEKANHFYYEISAQISQKFQIQNDQELSRKEIIERCNRIDNNIYKNILSLGDLLLKENFFSTFNQYKLEFNEKKFDLLKTYITPETEYNKFIFTFKLIILCSMSHITDLRCPNAYIIYEIEKLLNMNQIDEKELDIKNYLKIQLIILYLKKGEKISRLPTIEVERIVTILDSIQKDSMFYQEAQEWRRFVIEKSHYQYPLQA
ncbi:MAG: YtxH domain-containing protein [Candidatus Rhabdochlamydia sp.]